MAILFFPNLAIYKDENLPKSVKMAIWGRQFARYKIDPEKMAIWFLIFLQKWQNIAKSGHTEGDG